MRYLSQKLLQLVKVWRVKDHVAGRLLLKEEVGQFVAPLRHVQVRQREGAEAGKMRFMKSCVQRKQFLKKETKVSTCCSLALCPSVRPGECAGIPAMVGPAAGAWCRAAGTGRRRCRTSGYLEKKCLEKEPEVQQVPIDDASIFWYLQ